MARETKVGLLAGLAFIICFAIILANRGRESPTASRSPVLIGDAVSSAGLSKSEPSPRAGARGTERSERDIRSAARDDTSPVRPSPLRTDDGSGNSEIDVAASSGGDVVLPRSARRVAETSAARQGAGRARSLPTGHPMDNASTLTATTTPAGNPGLTAPDQDQGELQRQLQRHLDAIDGKNGKEGTGGSGEGQSALVKSDRGSQSKPSSGAGPQASPSNSYRQYTVKSGDTLTRIATQHYGRATDESIRAIFDANRSKLASPDELRVGVELVIPALCDSRQAAGRGLDVRKLPPAERVTRPTSGETFRWYQIRPGDRYETIAREQLGDSGRWREIYEINKDKFPDPGRIRHGVRIKIPVTGSDAAGGRSS